MFGNRVLCFCALLASRTVLGFDTRFDGKFGWQHAAQVQQTPSSQPGGLDSDHPTIVPTSSLTPTASFAPSMVPRTTLYNGVYWLTFTLLANQDNLFEYNINVDDEDASVACAFVDPDPTPTLYMSWDTIPNVDNNEWGCIISGRDAESCILPRPSLESTQVFVVARTPQRIGARLTCRSIVPLLESEEIDLVLDDLWQDQYRDFSYTPGVNDTRIRCESKGYISFSDSPNNIYLRWNELPVLFDETRYECNDAWTLPDLQVACALDVPSQEQGGDPPVLYALVDISYDGGTASIKCTSVPRCTKFWRRCEADVDCCNRICRLGFCRIRSFFS